MPVPLHWNHWNVRRATLVDVPVVARLIEPPVTDTGEPDSAFTSATRLVLAHVGLESGEFWVATDEDGDVLAAAVLLPPRIDAAGLPTAISDGVTTALRLHLGCAPLVDIDALAGVPGVHWLLIAVAAEGAEPVLGRLLTQGLPTVDAAGLPVLAVRPGRAAAALIEAGFQPQLPAGDVAVLVRPAGVQPSGPVLVPALTVEPAVAEIKPEPDDLALTS